MLGMNFDATNTIYRMVQYQCPKLLYVILYKDMYIVTVY